MIAINRYQGNCGNNCGCDQQCCPRPFPPPPPPPYPPYGVIGPTGPQGVQGIQGVPGNDGKSAYDAALDGGYQGTETQFNAALAQMHGFALAADALKYRTNPNLLDNWYFGNPVNQRGQTGYTGKGYTVDRWTQNFDGTLTSTLTDDGIKIAAGNDGTYKNFEQILPYVPTNTTFTMSFLVDNFASIAQIYTGFSTAQFDIRDNLITWTFKTGDSISGVKTIGIQTKAGKTVTIKAAKLELGSTQTLAHKENGVWVLNEIPDFGEQLRRCQRYFARLSGDSAWSVVGIAECYGTNSATLCFWLPVPMRTIPSIVASGLTVNGVAVSSITADQYNPTCLKYKGTLATNVPAGIYAINQYGSGYVDVSADL